MRNKIWELLHYFAYCISDWNQVTGHWCHRKMFMRLESLGWGQIAAILLSTPHVYCDPISHLIYFWLWSIVKWSNHIIKFHSVMFAWCWPFIFSLEKPSHFTWIGIPQHIVCMTTSIQGYKMKCIMECLRIHKSTDILQRDFLVNILLGEARVYLSTWPLLFLWQAY